VTGDVHVTELRDYLDASLARGFIPLPLAEHRSPPLAELIQQINKQSSNWLADRVIMTAAARRYGGAPTMDRAVEAMYAWLSRRVGLGRDQAVIDTGSGLSYRTQLSARQVVSVLRVALGLVDDPERAARLAKRRAAFRASLAVGGKDGTIRRRFQKLDARLLGKTGTLRQVVALSGLLEVADDRRVVFSIISNGHPGSRRARVRRAHEELVGVLAEYLHHLD
jgi:serine-type D-Ala-D-Ala carboxypeptidase/endopeptidase (penicillin-binding protein 4)